MLILIAACVRLFNSIDNLKFLVLVELGKNIASTENRLKAHERQIEEAEETSIKADSVASSLE